MITNLMHNYCLHNIFILNTGYIVKANVGHLTDNS